jgi:iron complex outermembrane receptor protein
MRIFRIAAKRRLCALLLSVLCTTVLLGTAAAAPPAQARSVTYNLDIPAQNLNDALQAFALVSQHKLLYSPELVDGKRSPALKGRYTTEEAVRALLSGTHLIYEVTSDGLLLIRTEAPPAGSKTIAPFTRGSADIPIQLAQSDSTATSISGAANTPTLVTATRDSPSVASDSERYGLSEIIVTAQKKTERLQDVPVPVTAISAETLTDNNLTRLQDYYASVPGLSLTPADANGVATLAIRGITTGAYTNPTVATLLDDVPLGSSTNLGGGALIPDIDPSDLARVEVLRGPQGTLYGASSLGGLLKFVTADPSTNGFTGRVQGDVNQIHNGDGAGYGIRGAVNIPLSDTWALRVSGFARRDPGYIDDPVHHLTGVNWGDAQGGRLSALWRPSTEFSLKLSALIQDSTTHGSPFANVAPGLGDLQQNNVPGTGGYGRHIQAYSAIANATLGSTQLTSVTGYNVNTLNDSFDYTSLFGTYTQGQFGVMGTPLTDHDKTEKFTQELRFTVPLSSRVDWLLGGFYTHEYSPILSQILAADENTGAVVGSWVAFDWKVTYAEYAAFTDFTVHLTDRFEVQLGGRQSWIRQTYEEVDTGPYVPIFEGFPSPLVFPEVITHENAFTYLVTPQFRVSPDLMVYGRLASGYRPGGPNPTASVFGLPDRFNADKTQNYEVGVKGDALAHRLSFDASVYYIDWKDIQLTLTDPSNGLGYFSNGSRAKSEGVELSVETRPASGLTISGWVAWDNAVLTDNFPAHAAAYGVSGNRLPYSSRFSGKLALEDEVALGSSVLGFIGGSVTYLSDRLGIFLPAGQERQTFPAYAQTDLRVGVRYGGWNANLYLNNVADKRGILTGGAGTFNPAAFDYIQPRTVGLSVSKNF